MSLPRLHDMAPLWLNSAVKHIAKPLVGEQRILIKKRLGPVVCGAHERGWIPRESESCARGGYGGAEQASGETEISSADTMDGRICEH